MNDSNSSLYAKRQKIYPRQVHGLYAFWRTTGVVVLLGLYYILPWVKWNGEQAVLFDLPARKFHLFGLTLWPQDFIYLALLLILAALTLFFFTALAGRLWCGYACPQTVWTEIFMWIERKIEGDRSKQIKLDKQHWNRKKILLKGSKHVIWIVFSLYTGLTFVGYFTPIAELTYSLLHWTLGPWETFWIFFYGFATYGNAGWMREQVCIYMCPYARFQSAMFDKNTLIISYDKKRGEPRGSRRKSADPKALGLGDCVDCTLCQQVCPTGIDIRDGLQYQCIACAACVDVCDEVMEKLDYPKGLIRYTTENRLQGKETKILRPRVILYGVLLASLTGILLYSLATRIPIQFNVIRDRAQLYRTADNGMIENLYTLKIANMDLKDHLYRIKLSGPDGLALRHRRDRIKVPAGELIELPVTLQIRPEKIARPRVTISITVTDSTDSKLSKTVETSFFAPVRRHAN